MQQKKEPPFALMSKKVEVKDGTLSSIKVSYEVPEIAWIGYVLKSKNNCDSHLNHRSLQFHPDTSD